jgi:hypothetical protein
MAARLARTLGIAGMADRAAELTKAHQLGGDAYSSVTRPKGEPIVGDAKEASHPS